LLKDFCACTVYIRIHVLIHKHIRTCHLQLWLRVWYKTSFTLSFGERKTHKYSEAKIQADEGRNDEVQSMTEALAFTCACLHSHYMHKCLCICMQITQWSPNTTTHWKKGIQHMHTYILCDLHTHACTHTRTLWHIHIQIHTHTQTHIHTRTDTHT